MKKQFKKQLTVIKDSVSHWSTHNAGRMGAAVAYYTIFSLAPLIILLIGIASMFFSRAQVIGNLTEHITSAFGPAISHYILSATTGASALNLGTIGAILSVFVLLFTAIGTLNEVATDLQELWLVPKKPKVKRLTIWGKIKAYAKARGKLFLIVFLGGILLGLSIGVSILLNGVPGHAIIQNMITLVLGITLLVVLYRLLPEVKLPLSELIVGALLTMLLFLIGKILIGVYLSHANTDTYGAAGTLIALLIWIFYSAQVFFLAASWIFTRSKRNGYLAVNKNG